MHRVNFVVKAPPLQVTDHVIVEHHTIQDLRAVQEELGFEITTVEELKPMDYAAAVARIQRVKREIGG